MAKAKHPLLRLFIFSLLLIAIPIIAAPFVPLASIKPEVESRLSTLLGRPVSVGSMRLSFLGGPYLYINQLTAKEDPTFGDGTFMQTNQLRANFSLLAYVLHKRVELDSVRLQSPDITFVKNPEGVWSWTTLGKPQTAQNALQGSPMRIGTALLFAVFWGSLGEPNREEITIEQATVRLQDKAAAQPTETLYRNVNLQVTIDRPADNNSHATGQLKIHSDESDGAQLVHTEMPFDLTIDRSSSPAITAQGSLGPGAIESKNFAADNFKSALEMRNGSVMLKQMEMNLYDGSLKGNLQLNLGTERFDAEGEAQNLNLDTALASKLQLPGQLTGHINSRFKLGGLLRSFQETVPTIIGDGHVSSSGLFIASVNLSQQVAQALKLDQIGDMNQGTQTGALESDFHIEQGVVRTSNLQIQQLDGLGDATANDGWFKVEATPSFNYAASILLSNEATAKVKNTSPLIGVAVSVLEVNHRVTVPVNLSGEVRNPQVTVDVQRLILGY
jgi:uncharacterized protein involved in outer membrane biogenesis